MFTFNNIDFNNIDSLPTTEFNLQWSRAATGVRHPVAWGLRYPASLTTDQANVALAVG